MKELIHNKCLDVFAPILVIAVVIFGPLKLFAQCIQNIQNAKSCDVRTPGLDIAEDMLTHGWWSDECGFDPVKTEPPPYT